MAYSINETCIGCTLCARSCPMGAISGQLKQLHTIDPELCVNCGVCGRVCKPGAVLDPYGRRTRPVDRKLWKKPRVDAEGCYGCSLCVIHCAFDCLTISRPKFKGDIHTVAELTQPNQCVGCGLCVEVCPVDAIDMAKPTGQKWTGT